jgi:hypothetical protein
MVTLLQKFLPGPRTPRNACGEALFLAVFGGFTLK